MSDLVEYRMVHGDGRATTETHLFAEALVIPRRGAPWLWDHYAVRRIDGVLTALWQRVEDRSKQRSAALARIDARFQALLRGIYYGGKP